MLLRLLRSPITILISALLLSTLQYSDGYFEFCSGSKLYTVKHSDCPGGVVFQAPVEFKCSYPAALPYTTDICTGVKSDVTGAAGDTDTYQAHVIEMTDDKDPTDLAVPPYNEQSCRASGNPCESVEILEINSRTSPPGDSDTMIANSRSIFGSEERDNVVEGVVTNDALVKEQTHRLLMFLNGLIIDEDEQGPKLRIVEVLRKSFEVIQAHCPKTHVPKVFTDQVLKSFLFMLREGDLAVLKDIDEDDFNHIMEVLNNCAVQKPSPEVVFAGRDCVTRGDIFNITRASGNYPSYILQRNELSFRWGKYDPPTDVTWGVTDFVHGLCYGKFWDNVNKHHLYQRAMEMLFTPEIIYRWARPFMLAVPHYWDHALRANMRNVMKNLEGCIQGAYIGSPFLHRLERPMARFNASGPYVRLDPSIVKRKKRGVAAAQLEELNGNAYCFQKKDDREKMVTAIKLTSCDGTEAEEDPTAP